MENMFVVIILTLVALVYLFRIYCIVDRKQYYEEVCLKLSHLAKLVDLKNREFYYALLHYVTNANQNKTAIVDFKKNVVNMIKNYQKRDKLTDEFATKILDTINRRWVERHWSLYFIDKKIIDSKMVV